MTIYNVHVYREMRIKFDGIEAPTPEAAAAIAAGKPTDEAADIADCEGENLAALVDVVGDEEYEQSRAIDFEPERLRKAASRLLDALRCITCCPMIQGPIGTTAYIVSDERMAQARASIAEADDAAIASQPSAPSLLSALNAVLPYAESEAESLYECWRRDGDLQIKDASERCRRAIENAQAAVAEAKAAGIPPLSATGERPSRFRFTHEPEENPDRAYVLVDGKFDVKIVRTDEGIVIDAYSGDGIDDVSTLTLWYEDVAEPEHDAAEGA
jgi:hypothetical protein